MNNTVSGLLLAAFVALSLAGCGNEDDIAYGPKQWQGLQIVVETRPAPVTAGMNEFIVIISRGNNRPGVGMVVSLRTDDGMEWRQAIQDGYTGVYRRAIPVNDPQRDVLAVNLRNTSLEEGEQPETTLYFPLNRPGVKQ